MNKLYFIILVVILVGIGIGYLYNSGWKPENTTDQSPAPNQSTLPNNEKSFDFSKLNKKYRFSAKLPEGLIAEFVPSIEAINISDQIFIRYFEANEFLTLNTVNILDRQETNINGHRAVRYEIEKKDGIPDFPDQPLWRSRRHKLIDIRLTANNPSLFYVIAYSPDFSEQEFNKFVESLIFHNDKKSFTEPLP